MMTQLSNALGRHNLNPVVVRVKKECNRLHFAVLRPLVEPHAKLFKPLARDSHIVNRDGDVAEALRLGIAVMVRKVLVVLRAMVVRKLKYSLALEKLASTCLLYTSPSPRD